MLRSLTKAHLKHPLNLISTRSIKLSAVDRNPNYSKIEDKDIEYFKKILGESAVVTSQHELSKYNNDWMSKYKGESSVALKPKSTQEVSQILKYCNERKLAVCPQGGNTGLVGGSVPLYDEVVLSLSRMDKIKEFNINTGIVIAEAGVILENLEKFVNDKDHIIPLDLGAKGSCQIGGNAATNAGGIRLLRYGSLHGTILGLEVVLANGEVLDSLTTLRKDNTGYDLKQLFIGSEGTLGIITAVSVLCPPKPLSVNVALLSVNSFDKTLKILQEAKKDLGEILSAFEFFDNGCLKLMTKHFESAKDPFSDPSPFYVLIETSGSNVHHDKEKLDAFLEKISSEELCTDGTVAQDKSQQQKIWFLREAISSACGHEGKVYKYDLSLPTEHMYSLVETVRERFKDDKQVQVVGYGHLGDGNLHLNMIAPEYTQERFSKLEPFVYEFTSSMRGSISAEHGIGVMKPSVLHFSKTAPMINVMKGIKNLLDPNNILNPYKVLPTDI
eukprot:TRINITY_DN3156_c0_g1_i2.p1 TRINITY_DN3156_c0_g1~~TRINITY_DN3156_c0_g1_i2.p1  ORF type:complete len:500 (-),score=94.37 TRINITY_DN3156_c0_g1_i2:2445-3944(-)